MLSDLRAMVESGVMHNPVDREAQLLALAGKFAELDRHLSEGGSPPSDWRKSW